MDENSRKTTICLNCSAELKSEEQEIKVITFSPNNSIKGGGGETAVVEIQVLDAIFHVFGVTLADLKNFIPNLTFEYTASSEDDIIGLCHKCAVLLRLLFTAYKNFKGESKDRSILWQSIQWKKEQANGKTERSSQNDENCLRKKCTCSLPAMDTVKVKIETSEPELSDCGVAYDDDYIQQKDNSDFEPTSSKIKGEFDSEEETVSSRTRRPRKAKLSIQGTSLQKSKSKRFLREKQPLKSPNSKRGKVSSNHGLDFQDGDDRLQTTQLENSPHFSVSCDIQEITTDKVKTETSETELSDCGINYEDSENHEDGNSNLEAATAKSPKIKGKVKYEERTDLRKTLNVSSHLRRPRKQPLRKTSFSKLKPKKIIHRKKNCVHSSTEDSEEDTDKKKISGSDGEKKGEKLSRQNRKTREKPNMPSRVGKSCEVCGSSLDDTSVSNRDSRLLCAVCAIRERHMCEICGKSYSTKSGLNKHKKNHTGVRPFLCNTCGKSFIERGQLNEHLQIHTGERPYVCDTCGMSFVLLKALNNHKRVHTGEKRHQCEICGRRFADAINLRVHGRVHTGEKQFSCSMCDQTFAHISSLKGHEMRHKKLRPYKCEICGEGFAHPTTLSHHMIDHSGKRTHECSICGRKFAKAVRLRQHFRVHTGEKPYECKYCQKHFSSSTNLKNHVRTHTGEKPYKCDDCEKSFSTHTNYRIHRERRHEKQQEQAFVENEAIKQT